MFWSVNSLTKINYVMSIIKNFISLDLIVKIEFSL